MLIDIEHVAKLARIKLTEAEKTKFHGELEKILAHFTELQKLDTSGVNPMTGGTQLKDIFREDFSPFQVENERLTSAFPETKNGYLKVPGVFDQ